MFCALASTNPDQARSKLQQHMRWTRHHQCCGGWRSKLPGPLSPCPAAPPRRVACCRTPRARVGLRSTSSILHHIHHTSNVWRLRPALRPMRARRARANSRGARGAPLPSPTQPTPSPSPVCFDLIRVSHIFSIIKVRTDTYTYGGVLDCFR